LHRWCDAPFKAKHQAIRTEKTLRFMMHDACFLECKALNPNRPGRPISAVDGVQSNLACDGRAPYAMSTNMTLRTTRTFVTFVRPFWLDEAPELQPAGTYVVQTDEEQIEGLSFLAYRRLATTISLPLNGAPKGSVQIISVDPADLEAALRRDGEALGRDRAPCGAPPG
jgi:hypothetical protein